MGSDAGKFGLLYSYEPSGKRGQIKSDNGNMTAGYDLTDPANVASRAITWNADNLPSQIQYTKGGSTATVDFLYDGEGGRWKKTKQGGPTTYYIGSHYEVKDGVATLYVFAGSKRIAKITGVDKHYFHKDHLGSSTVVSNASGVTVEATEYMPFGSSRQPMPSPMISHYKYTDQELDPETGLYFYGARYYDPVIGRFVSADTIVQAPFDPQTLNRYTYCRNNPLVYIDPSGNIFGIDDIIIGAIIGAAIGGATAGVTGGDIGKGILTGAIGGAFFGAAGYFASMTEVFGAEAYSVVGAKFTAFEQAAIYAGAGATGGGINAGITGGNVGVGAISGALLGLSAGTIGVPDFEPFGSGKTNSWAGTGNRFFNTALTGAAFGAAYEGMTGGDIGQGAAMGALGWMAGEATNMAIGHSLGYAISGKGPRYENGAFYYYSKGQVPFTVGGVIIGDATMLRDWNYINGRPYPQYSVDQHERAHFPQQIALSVSYIPAHLISQGAGGIVGSFTGAGFWSGTHRYNIFERWWIDVPSY